MIGVVDCGLGNIGSIVNMLNRVGESPVVSGDPRVLEGVDGLVLPGVGPFDRGMAALDALGLCPLLEEARDAGTPVLGVCLGMHLLTRGSDEGTLPGLGWIEADVVRFQFANGSGLRVPHMGWNSVRPTRSSELLPDDTPLRYYFVHSYKVVCDDPADVLCETTYGVDFVSGVARGNVYGVQFHPEKSHAFGLDLFQRFARLVSAESGE